MTMISATPTTSNYTYNPDPSITNYSTGLNAIVQSGMSTSLLPAPSSPLDSSASAAYALDGNLVGLDQLNGLQSDSQVQTLQKITGSGAYSMPIFAPLSNLDSSFSTLNQLDTLSPTELSYEENLNQQASLASTAVVPNTPAASVSSLYADSTSTSAPAVGSLVNLSA